MTITQLPLLPEKWELWDWRKSNGSATDEQTKSAYHALTAKGLCIEFPYLVWNDLVNTLENALDQAGIKWDATYGTADSCKLSGPFQVFSASAFNAVARNIKNLSFIQWKWSTHEEAGGYIGRDAFHGFSTHGSSADNLYGWHILELTNKLNRLIQVLKGEADFGSFPVSEKAKTYTPSQLTGFNDPAFIANTISQTKTCVPLSAAKVQEILTQAFSVSNPQSVMLMRNAAHLEAMRFSESVPKSRLRIVPTASFSASGKSTSVSSAKLLPSVPFPLKILLKATSYENSAILAQNAIPGPATAISKSNTRSGLVTGHAFPVDTSIFCETATDATAVCVAPFPVAATDAAKSLACGEITLGKNLYLEAGNTSKTFPGAVIVNGWRNLLGSADHSESTAVVDATLCKGSLISAYGQSQSVPKGIAAGGSAGAFTASKKSATHVSCIMELEYVPKETWRDPIQTGSNLYITSVWWQIRDGNNVRLEAGAVWFDPVQTRADLYIRSACPQRQGGSNLDLGDGVWFEPIQIGRNLYIRSNESMKGVDER